MTDSKTSEPLSYATIRLKNNQIGVFTNAEGDFRVPDYPAFQSDSLIITCIGYFRRAVALRDLEKNSINSLKLICSTYDLNEVKVIARKSRLNSEAIVGRAIRNIKKNCPAGPFNYVSYYRDYQKDSSDYLNLNEAIIQTLDTGFVHESKLNKYRLLDFKRNPDFRRLNITPYYDLPETEHSDLTFKRIPYAVVGDQYGNELFILLVHDLIRNFTTRSFSFVDTLSKDFINNHIFSEPVGIREGNTILYKIKFVTKRQITGNTIQMNGSIIIQPDDYSIHKFQYSASYLNHEKKEKEIFNIEIEYGHEPAVNSRMCLKYISFNNSFIIPDARDTTYFHILETGWRQIGGPYVYYPWNDMTIVTFFNNKIDTVSAKRVDNYEIYFGKNQRKAKITRIKVDGKNLYLTIRDDQFQQVLDSFSVKIHELKDINGNKLNDIKKLELRQFRELFVQDYNDPLEFENGCYIESIPLEQNCITKSRDINRFWMNSPLKPVENISDKNSKTLNN